MIGLEYVLKLWDITQQELGEKLGIKQQNIDSWIKGKRNIPKKHLPKLVEIFNISEEYFQKELIEKDKLTIQQLKIRNELITYDYEYTEFNSEIREEVTVYCSQVDQEQELEDHLLQFKKDIIILHENIDKTIGKLELYDGNYDAIEILDFYNMFVEIIKNGKIQKSVIKNILRGMKHYEGKSITSEKNILLISEFIKRLNEK